MDWWGVLFIVITVGALLTALNEASKLVGAFDGGVLTGSLILLVVALAAFAAFWAVEKRSTSPWWRPANCGGAICGLRC